MKARQVAIGAVLAGAVLAAAGARAEEGVLMKSLLGTIGIIPEDRDAIDYRERAPLVLPPRMDLREPSRADGAQARNAQWPNDPEMVARKREEAEARVPVTESQARRMNDRERLSPEEMQGGRRQTSSYSQPQPAKGEGKDSYWIRPDILRSQGRSGGDDTSVLADGEPNRTRLAQPPSGMRKPAPGAPVKADSEPVVREDEADPRAFQRQQARR
jgi:hypothetical protein